MKSYKWGFIGCGHIAHKMAKALQLTERGILYAVSSSSAERADEFKRLYNVSKAYTSYKEMLEDPEVDVVYIATPHSHHYLHTRMSLEAGKAVICEKPFTIDRQELTELISLSRSRNLFLMEALWTRFLPHIEKAGQLINEGAIGDLVMLSGDFGFAAEFKPEGRLFNRDLGGGALLDIGIYPVFLAYHFLGVPEKIKALATFASTGVDVQLGITMQHRNNTISDLNTTLLSKTRMEAMLFGTAGSIRMHERWYAPTCIELLRNDKIVERFDLNQSNNGFEFEANEVMRCLDEGMTESPVWSLDNSLDLIGILDDIRTECNITYPNRIR